MTKKSASHSLLPASHLLRTSSHLDSPSDAPVVRKDAGRCGYVRLCAAMCGYVRIIGKRGQSLDTNYFYDRITTRNPRRAGGSPWPGFPSGLVARSESASEKRQGLAQSKTLARIPSSEGCQASRLPGWCASARLFEEFAAFSGYYHVFSLILTSAGEKDERDGNDGRDGCGAGDRFCVRFVRFRSGFGSVSEMRFLGRKRKNVRFVRFSSVSNGGAETELYRWRGAAPGLPTSAKCCDIPENHA
jgi:hypothetical protein